MKQGTALILSIFLWAAAFSAAGQNAPVKQVMDVPAGFCISEAEWRLHRMINEYRREYDLPPIPLSQSLCFVARTHVKDLYLNHPDKDPCNSHSWSDKGPWKPFCYPGDEGKKGSVWDKPKELTKYNSKGYEIVYWENNPVVIDSVISFWKSIDYFNSFLMNTGKWQGKRWNAIGIGIWENYAVAWFGEVPDPDGVPYVCGKEPIKTPATTDTSKPKEDSIKLPATAKAEPVKPVQAPPAQPVKKTPGLYYIVVKSQRPLEESNRLADTLKAKGYPEAKVLQTDGKIRVVIFEALNRDQANQKLAEAKKLYRDAWILIP
jgi:SPOR domain/Cysteine-rich secretory protein family